MLPHSLGRQNNLSLKWGGTYEPLFEFAEVFVHKSADRKPANGSGAPAVNFPGGSTSVQHAMVAGSRYSLRMAVVDSTGCSGTAGNITFTSKSDADVKCVRLCVRRVAITLFRRQLSGRTYGCVLNLYSYKTFAHS